MSLALSRLKKRSFAELTKKPKKPINRFDGLTEEEVQKYTLDDILEPNLDLVFVGINPSLMAAHRGRYYAGPGNHFYKLLHESGLVPRFVSFEEDKKLLNYKIGLTNIVARATRSSADLKKPEIKEGSIIVREKLRIFKPKIAIFNGKCIYEVFAEKTAKSEFYFGLQPERVDQTAIWVVPSSSARCAHFPRMADKLHFYLALKKYLSLLDKGEIGEVDESEFRFEGKCKQTIASTSKMWRRKDVSAFIHGGRVANKNTICLDTSEENIATVKSNEFVVTEILVPSENVAISTEGNNSDETDSSEKKISRETKNECCMSVCDLAATSSPNIREKNSKRPWERIYVNKPRDNADSMDFMNLIKRRLSEKRLESEERVGETSSKPVKEGKKLKYSNLRLNCDKKMLNATTDPSDPSSD